MVIWIDPTRLFFGAVRILSSVRARQNGLRRGVRSSAGIRWIAECTPRSAAERQAARWNGPGIFRSLPGKYFATMVRQDAVIRRPRQVWCTHVSLPRRSIGGFRVNIFPMARV